MRKRAKATDHRALVLEVVATTPSVALRRIVQHEVASLTTRDEFGVNAISAMVSQLLREGLLGRKEDGTLFVTVAGLEYLQGADFTRQLPAAHERPSRRKKPKE